MEGEWYVTERGLQEFGHILKAISKMAAGGLVKCTMELMECKVECGYGKRTSNIAALNVEARLRPFGTAERRVFTADAAILGELLLRAARWGPAVIRLLRKENKKIIEIRTRGKAGTTCWWYALSDEEPGEGPAKNAAGEEREISTHQLHLAFVRAMEAVKKEEGWSDMITDEIREGLNELKRVVKNVRLIIDTDYHAIQICGEVKSKFVKDANEVEIDIYARLSEAIITKLRKSLNRVINTNNEGVK